MLDQQEKQYLRSLQDNPVWMGIIQKIATLNPPPVYRPQDGDKNFHRWIYESGVLMATTNMLSVLMDREIRKEDLKNE